MTHLVSDFIIALTHANLVPVTDAHGVTTRLFGLGLGVTCPRCLGGGFYGPTQVEGGVCFGCKGRRLVAPQLTPELLTRVRAEVTEETLAAYAATLIAKKVAKQTAAGSLKRANAAKYGGAWYQFWYVGGTGRERGLDFSQLAFAMRGMSDDAEHALHSACYAAKTFGHPAEVVLAAEQAALEAFAAVDHIFLTALESGEIAADQARGKKLRAEYADHTRGTQRLDAEQVHRHDSYARARELFTATKREPT